MGMGIKFEPSVTLGHALQGVVLLVAAVLAYGQIEAYGVETRLAHKGDVALLRSEASVAIVEAQSANKLLVQQMGQVIEVLGEIKQELKEIRK